MHCLLSWHGGDNEDEVTDINVTLSPETLNLVVGETGRLEVKITPIDANQNVTWRSSDESVATVRNGVVNAVGVGVATIGVLTEVGGKTARSQVIVTERTYPVESVSLDQASLRLLVGETATLTATILPENATNTVVEWSTDNDAVATVNDGTVKAIGAGSATVTVKTADGGKTATCSVEVEETTEISIHKMSYERLADMNTQRSAHQIFAYGDEIIAVGGHTDGFSLTSTLEYYKDGTWTQIRTDYPHDNGFGLTLSDGTFLIGGGCSYGGGNGQTPHIERFDPATHAISYFGRMGISRTMPKALELENGRLIFTGNWYASDNIEENVNGVSSKLKKCVQGRCNPYILRTAKNNAIIFAGADTRGGSTSLLVDRVDGESYVEPIFTDYKPTNLWESIKVEDAFIGNVAEDKYHYLISMKNRSDETMALFVTDGEKFKQVNLKFPVPQFNPANQENIQDFASIYVNRQKQEAYWVSIKTESSGSIVHILKVSYANALTDEACDVSLWYSDLIPEAATGSCTVLSDGRFIICGGVYNTNFTTYKSVFALKPFE